MALNPAASEENFRRLERDEEMFAGSIGLISAYLECAFPDPVAEEVEQWTLSCLPSTNRGARLFTLNIGPMEVLFVERADAVGDDLAAGFMSLYVSRSALEEESGTSIDAVAQSAAAVELVPSRLASADGDAIRLVADLADEAAADELDALIGSGLPIRRLAEKLVAKGKGPYEQYHNPWFAAAVLEEIERSAEAEKR
ncbi:hypothetical protein ACFYRW_16880 [Rhodococcus pyridinivorans]|uniref:hypothetical protein n=1 Tax=Rhodococcus TaxID=1827 RepID=UPI0007D94659|nr:MULTISPECIES: hypothetical protein [unclassified Rhodococcus (in: high G+C Gram-positive bacteria)]APE10818.1 hypothetical protein BO226_17770 [Rhodococcus sp. 2G]